jgi:hypothetical protein
VLRVDQTNNSFSRVQFTVEYDESLKSWVVYDGCETKKSTNGTWLFVQKSLRITENISYKIENSFFTIEIVNK